MKAHEPLVRALAEQHPETAARALERLEPGEAAKVLSSLPAGPVTRVVERLAPYAAAAILHQFSPEQIRDLLESMGPKQASAVLRHLEEQKRGAALAAMPEQAARRLQELLRYAPETAAGMMDPQAVSIPADVTVQEAISLLRRAPRQSLHYLYVTDREAKLVGVLGMRDLLLAGPREPVETIIRRDIRALKADLDREEVAAVMRETRYAAMPVVDAENRLLGVVKSDDVLKAVQDEAFEDLQRMVGAGGDELATAPVGLAVKKRLPWLLVNLATAFLASAVISMFEGVLARVTALSVLMTIVAGQGGNTGAQALAVVIRGLAVREILPGMTWRILLKELAAGFLNGLAVAGVTALGTFAWYRSAALAAVIGAAMIVNMTAAALAGASIPLVLHKLGRDPAQSSSIFMTTVTDVVGFAAFLGFALMFMKHLAPA
jgi:magnesium transporter